MVRVLESLPGSRLLPTKTFHELLFFLAKIQFRVGRREYQNVNLDAPELRLFSSISQWVPRKTRTLIAIKAMVITGHRRADIFSWRIGMSILSSLSAIHNALPQNFVSLGRMGDS